VLSWEYSLGELYTLWLKREAACVTGLRCCQVMENNSLLLIMLKSVPSRRHRMKPEEAIKQEIYLTPGGDRKD
jgi:hypothetical protein